MKYAQCHPEEPHYAKGMCRSCYKKWRYEETNYNLVNKGRREQNPQFYKEYQKQYRNNNRDALADKHLQRTYGISRADYNCILDNQNGCCALCGDIMNNPALNYNHQDNPVIDYCYETSTVRGIIHRKCNLLLDLADNNEYVLECAILYLKLHQK